MSSKQHRLDANFEALEGRFEALDGRSRRIGNDSRWNAEHVLQMKHYGENRTIGCELLPSRYDKIVQSLGGFGTSVDKLEDLEAALKDAIDSKLPACVNVSIEGRAAPVFS